MYRIKKLNSLGRTSQTAPKFISKTLAKNKFSCIIIFVGYVLHVYKKRTPQR